MTDVTPEVSPAQEKSLRIAQEVVARALFQVSGGGDFDALDDTDRGLMLEAAVAAIIAHTAWMDAAGFRVIPPGMTLRPQSENEAREMAKQVRAYLDQPEHALNRRRGLLEKPKLILPFDA